LLCGTIGFAFRDPLTNNCGPGWSDGKWQTSVDHFKTKPLNTRDRHCQEHDSNTKRANGDRVKLDKADDIFYNSLVRDRTPEFSADYILGSLYGNVVYYGNRLSRMSQAFTILEPSTPNGNLRVESAPGGKSTGQTKPNSVDNLMARETTTKDVVYAPVQKDTKNQPKIVYEVDNDAPVIKEIAKPNKASGPMNIPTLNLDNGGRNFYGGNNPFIFFNRYRFNNKKRYKRNGVGARNMHRVFVSN